MNMFFMYFPRDYVYHMTDFRTSQIFRLITWPSVYSFDCSEEGKWKGTWILNIVRNVQGKVMVLPKKKNPDWNNQTQKDKNSIYSLIGGFYLLSNIASGYTPYGHWFQV